MLQAMATTVCFLGAHAAQGGSAVGFFQLQGRAATLQRASYTGQNGCMGPRTHARDLGVSPVTRPLVC